MAELSRLPGPVADLWDWQLEGSCRQINPDVFFHPEGERGSARRSRDAAAKEVCLGCPVLVQCREHALRVREPYGVWGGEFLLDGEIVLVKRGRGRPAHRPLPDDVDEVTGEPTTPAVA